MKKLFPLLLALLTSPPFFVHAQNLVISTDGTHCTSADQFDIMDQEPATGNVNTVVSLHFSPGRIRRQTATLSAPALFNLDDLHPFLAGIHDSLGVGLDAAGKKYIVTGGKYPGNYTIYASIRDILLPYDKYKKEEDNYTAYAQLTDSVSGLRTALLQKAWQTGQLSPDVYDYMQGYIRYTHLACLLRTRSKTLLAALPRTASTFCPTITAADFRKDAYAPQIDYIFCALRYIRLTTDPLAAGATPATTRYELSETRSVISDLQVHSVARLLPAPDATVPAHPMRPIPASHITRLPPPPATGDSAQQNRHALLSLRFAIDSLSAGTRERVLYAFIVNNQVQRSINDPAVITALDKEIQALGLPAWYATPIHRQFDRVLLKGRSIDPSRWGQVRLQTTDGQTVTMDAIFGAAPDPIDPSNRRTNKYLFDCWNPASMTNVRISSPLPASPYDEDHYRVLHIAIGDGKPASLKKWVDICRQQGITADQYYLITPSLSGILLLDKLPRYIAFNEDDGKIEDPDISIWQLTRIHTMSSIPAPDQQ
jgi:hypothetical protein